MFAPGLGSRGGVVVVGTDARKCVRELHSCGRGGSVPFFAMVRVVVGN